MRRFLLALLFIGLFTSALGAPVYSFGRLAIARSYQGPVVFNITWKDGTDRDVTSATGTIWVYSVAPTATSAGTVMWQKTLSPVFNPTNQFTFTVLQADTTPAGTFYTEVEIVEGSIRDRLYGYVVIEGS